MLKASKVAEIANLEKLNVGVFVGGAFAGGDESAFRLPAGLVNLAVCVLAMADLKRRPT